MPFSTDSRITAFISCGNSMLVVAGGVDFDVDSSAFV
jgi:hypothetical protein